MNTLLKIEYAETFGQVESILVEKTNEVTWLSPEQKQDAWEMISSNIMGVATNIRNFCRYSMGDKTNHVLGIYKQSVISFIDYCNKTKV